MGEFFYRMLACKKSGGEISENDKSENHVEPFEPTCPRQKRCPNDKTDGHDIENEEAVTKLLRNAAVAEI